MQFSSKRFAWSVVVAACALLATRPAVAMQAEQEHPKEATPAAQPDDKAGTDHGGSGGPNPLGFDPDLAIFTAIVFLLLFFTLSKFAWPQISAALEEREKKIADQIAAAEAKHEQAKRLLADHEAKLATTAGEVRALLEEAKRDADYTRKQGEAEGRKAKEEELARAIRDIQRAKDGAIQELSVAAANAAIDLAGNVVRSKLTPDEQSQLVREALGKLSQSVASRN